VQNKWGDLVDKNPLLKTRVSKSVFSRFTAFTARTVFLLKYLFLFYKEKLRQTFRELYSL
jgi:hypothetical protein